MRYRKTEELKATGIEWLREIPEEWGTPKIKWLFKQITSGSTPSSTNKKYYDGGTIPWVQTGDLNDGIINGTSKKITRAALQENSALKLFPEKTLLIAMYGATIGKLGMLENEAATNQACCALIKPRNTISEFIFYWLFGKRKEIVSLAYGGGQPNISQDVVKNLIIGLPPLPEQRSIAAFLDRKTEAIDGLIQKKEQLIERLKEKRQALITQAVTKGLDPNVPMKDSGIEWLGEIPEKWERIKLKYVANIFGRIGYRGYTTDDIVDEGQGAISLSPSNIKNDQLVLTENTYISWDKYHESPEIKIYENDIVLVKTGSTIGKTAIIPEDTPEMTINPQLVVLKDIRCNPEYLYYLTASPLVKYAFEIGQAGGSTPSISQEKIENFELVLPPTLEEQNEIINYLKSECKDINDAISQIENVIEKFKEYRQSLISAAVTGKIDVRDEVEVESKEVMA